MQINVITAWMPSILAVDTPVKNRGSENDILGDL